MRTGFGRTQRKRLAQPDFAHFSLSPTRRGRLAPAWEARPVITPPESGGRLTSSAADNLELHPVESPRRDTLQLYLCEIGQVKLLTPDEEIALAQRIRRGDKLAREQMIKANLRLVVKIARDYENLGLPLMDLISEGNIGLIKGVERFDPRKGAKLSTYAAWWIKQSIKRALANQSRTIRLPIHVVDKVASIQRAAAALHETFGREPSDDELTEHLGFGDARRVRLYREAARRPVELDAPISSESDPQSVVDIVADPNAAVPFDHLTKETDTELIRKALSDLSERETAILTMRFGLDGKKSMTLEAIGKKLGVTRERIRQLQNLALRKMRAGMQKRDTPFPENGISRAVAG